MVLELYIIADVDGRLYRQNEPFLRHTNGSDIRTKAVPFSMLEIVVGCFQWKRIVPVLISIITQTHTTYTHRVYKHYDEREQHEWCKLKTLMFMVLLFVSSSPPPEWDFSLKPNTKYSHHSFCVPSLPFCEWKIQCDGSIHKSLQNGYIAWFMYMVIGKFGIRFFSNEWYFPFQLYGNFSLIARPQFPWLIHLTFINWREPSFRNIQYKFKYVISPKVIEIKSIFDVQILFQFWYRRFIKTAVLKDQLCFANDDTN